MGSNCETIHSCSEDKRPKVISFIILLKGRGDVTGSREHTQKSCYVAYSVYYSAMCSWTLSLSYLLLKICSGELALPMLYIHKTPVT